MHLGVRAVTMCTMVQPQQDDRALTGFSGVCWKPCLKKSESSAATHVIKQPFLVGV